MVEINVQCAKSFQVHANSGRLVKKTWSAIKKRLETTEQKNEVEAMSLNKMAKVHKEVRDLTLIFIMPLLKICLYYEE